MFHFASAGLISAFVLLNSRKNAVYNVNYSVIRDLLIETVLYEALEQLFHAKTAIKQAKVG